MPRTSQNAAYSYRNDPDVPAFPDDKAVIVFDGVCVMCSAWARFVLKHDTARRYRLLPAQSDLGAALYRHYRLDPVNYETNVLIENGHAYFRSTGSIRMFVGLGFPWTIIGVLRVIPEPWRDRAYEFVAANRYRWFGRSDTCFIPGDADKTRFLP